MMIIKNLLRPITERYTNPMNLINFGIMGMNQRNVNYIGRYNKRNLYPLVDNKLKTKEIALKNGITTPKLLGVIHNQHDVQNIVEVPVLSRKAWHTELSSSHQHVTARHSQCLQLLVQVVHLAVLPGRNSSVQQ